MEPKLLNDTQQKESEMHLENLGKNLKKELAKRQTNQTKFAQLAGLNAGNISRIIRGQRKMHVQTLILLLKALPGMTAEDLLK